MADIKKFLSFLADDKRINKKVLLQYKEWLAQKYAVNSVNSMLAALNQFLEFLNAGKLKVKRIKVQKQPFLQDQKELTEKECRKLIATAMAEGKEQAEYYYFEVTPAMAELRTPIDELEMIVDKEAWPMPSYGDLIFEV